MHCVEERVSEEVGDVDARHRVDQCDFGLIAKFVRFEVDFLEVEKNFDMFYRSDLVVFEVKMGELVQLRKPMKARNQVIGEVDLFQID